ncbi:MAG: hypothetical protein OXB84_01505, partial [Halobacteriovoraceae bacterium]|nr:hypothetical protein [Halobacteriovoraceae bacterium]
MRQFELSFVVFLFLCSLQDAQSRGMFDSDRDEVDEISNEISNEIIISDFNFQIIKAAGKSFWMGSPVGEVHESVRFNER